MDPERTPEGDGESIATALQKVIVDEVKSRVENELVKIQDMGE